MRHQVWVAQLRTLSVEVEADSGADAERLVRRAAAGGKYDGEWLVSGTAVSVAQLDQVSVEAAGVAQRELLAVGQAADYLGISRTTLYSLLGSGELSSVRIGRRRFVARTQLDRYLSRQMEVE